MLIQQQTRRSRLASAACANAHGVAVAPDGKSVWVADSLRNRVLVYDYSGRRLQHRIRVGAMPWTIAFTQDGTQAWVTNSNDDTVSVIDTRTHRVVGTVSVSRIPTGIARHGEEMWVTGNVSSTVSVVDVARREVVASVPLGISSEPVAVAFA